MLIIAGTQTAPTPPTPQNLRTRGARRVEQEQGVVRLHPLHLGLRGLAAHGVLPPHVPPLNDAGVLVVGRGQRGGNGQGIREVGVLGLGTSHEEPSRPLPAAASSVPNPNPRAQKSGLALRVEACFISWTITVGTWGVRR